MKILEEHGSVISVVLAFIALTISATELFIVQPLKDQLEHEKDINVYAVEQFNKMSIKAKKLQDRVEELESANEALIKHAEPKSLVKAIKATPLPKPIKGDKNV